MPEEFLPHETIHHIKEELDELKKTTKGAASKDVKKAMRDLSDSINKLLDLFKEAAEGAEKEEATEKQLMQRVNSLERELAAIKGQAPRPAHAMIPPPKLPGPLKIQRPAPGPHPSAGPPPPVPGFPKPPRPFPKPLKPAPMPSIPRPKPRPEPLRIQPRLPRPAARLPPIPPGPLPPRPLPPISLPRFEEPIPAIMLEEEPPRKPGFFSKLFRKKKK